MSESKTLNFLENMQIPIGAEVINEVFTHKNIRIEKIVSNGSASPEDFLYDQDEDEWILILQGSARLLVEDQDVRLVAGDSYFIKRHQKHKVLDTSAESNTIWFAVFIK